MPGFFIDKDWYLFYKFDVYKKYGENGVYFYSHHKHFK